MRDWLLVQAVDDEDLSLACTRELVWLVAKAPQALQAAVAGATAMLLIAVADSASAAGYHAELGGNDTLAQLVGHIVEAELPGEQVREMLSQAKPVVRKVLEDASQATIPAAALPGSGE